MARHVAFLRAINVGGHVVKMDALRALCEQCGVSNVETFIASGNVIFDSRASATALEKKIEAQLLKGLGYEVSTFIRSIDELTAVVSKAEKAQGNWKTAYVGFLKAAPTREQQERVQAFSSAVERFAFAEGEIYWITNAGGVSDSKFSYAALERILKSPATFRNITTVRKIVQKYSREGE